MELTSTASIKSALVLLCGLFSLNVYRAATQSITTGEAITFDRLIRPPLRDTLRHYDVNNHVLNTLLVKRSVGLFRLSEFSFRLPSLLCGALYLWAVYRISRRTFGDGPLLVAAMALLSLNPLVLDELSIGSGYGMVLAFWMWGLVLMIEYLESGPEFRLRNLNLAGFCMGLSMTAHMAFVFPVLGVAISFLITAALGRRLSWAAFTERFVISTAATALVLLAIPLSHADASSFHFGPGTLYEMLHAVASASLSNRMATVAIAVSGGLVAVAVVSSMWIFVRREKKGVGSLVFLTAGGLAITLVLLQMAHYWTALRFPSSQGAAYVVSMCSLTVLALARTLNWRLVQSLVVVIVLLVVSQYLFQFNIGAYRNWKRDAGAKSLAGVLRRDAQGRHVRIGASAALDPILTFYRSRYRLANWELMRQLPLTGSFDYYVLDPGDAGIVAERHLRVLYSDRGLILAR